MPNSVPTVTYLPFAARSDAAVQNNEEQLDASKSNPNLAHENTKEVPVVQSTRRREKPVVRRLSRMFLVI